MNEVCLATGKICYSKKEAGNIKNRAYGKKVPKRIYYCEECGAYHLTHLPYFGFRKRNLASDGR